MENDYICNTYLNELSFQFSGVLFKLSNILPRLLLRLDSFISRHNGHESSHATSIVGSGGNSFIHNAGAFLTSEKHSTVNQLTKYGFTQKLVHAIHDYDQMSGSRAILSAASCQARLCHCLDTFLHHFVTVLHFISNKPPKGEEQIYWANGKLLNLYYLHSRTIVNPINIIDLHQVYNGCACAWSVGKLWIIISSFIEAFERVDCGQITWKGKILNQNTRSATPSPDNNSAQQDPGKCRLLPFLRIHLSVKTDMDNEIHHHLQCTRSAFRQLRKKLFTYQDLNLS